ncbi:MAG: hypothetical protein ABI954_02475 [Pyrinomonadaceae bacterium]
MNNFTLTKFVRRVLTPIFFALIVLLVLPNLATAQTGIPAADRELQLWRMFEPAGGYFRVSLPTQPVGNVIPFETKDSTLDMHFFSSQSKSSVYTVSYVDFDIPLKDSKALEAAFDTAGGEIKSKIPSAIMISEKKLMLGKIPGREFIFENGAQNFRAQMYLVKQRAYFAQLTRPQLNNLPAALLKVYQVESDKFFNSFQIVDNKKPEAPIKGKKTGK